MLTLEQVGALQGSILCGGNNMHPAMRANRGSEPALPTLSALIKQGWKCCYSAAEKASGPDFALLLTLPGLRAPRSVSLPSCGTLPGLSQLAESPGQANACRLSSNHDTRPGLISDSERLFQVWLGDFHLTFSSLV